MSKTYTIRGLCKKSSNPEVISKLEEICSGFEWKFNKSEYNRYSTEPGEFASLDGDSPNKFEDLINLSKTSEYLCLGLSKYFCGNNTRNILVSVKNLGENVRFSITYEDDVLHVSEREKYIFLNIAIGICLEMPLLRLYYSPAYEWVPSVTSQDGGADKLVVTDVSYIPLSHIRENNGIPHDLPNSADLIRVRRGYLLLCCERLFCSDSDRRAAADSLNLDPV